MRSLYTEDIEGNMMLIKEPNPNSPSTVKTIISKNIWTKSKEVPEILIRAHSINGLCLYQKLTNLISPGSQSEIQ